MGYLKVYFKFHLAFMLILNCFFYSNKSFSAGRIELDASSFFKTSEDRSNSSISFILNPKFEDEGSVLKGKVDLKAITLLGDSKSLTFEAKDTYLATSKKLLSNNQISLGRKFEQWSVTDNDWKMGLWSPRFLWNPLNPEIVGLTGFFYQLKTKKIKLMAFASPISVPERGVPINVENDQLTSNSPFFRPLPSSLELMENEIPINYSVEYPSVTEMLFRPGASLLLRYGEEEKGFWLQGTMGFMPIHQADLSLDTKMSLENEVTLNATVRPGFGYHQIATVESGYQTGNWSAWASVSGENPMQNKPSEGWMYVPMGSALITSWGGEWRLNDGFKIRISYLNINEKEVELENDMAVDIALPTRFQYKKAWKIAGKWRAFSPLTYSFNWIYDIDYNSNLISLDLTYQPSVLSRARGGSGMSFSIGTDIITSASQEGAIGQYFGDDRIRGKVSYVF